MTVRAVLKAFLILLMYGVVGRLYMDPAMALLDDEIICGNGKTATLTYFGREERKNDRRVISNFNTTFSEYMTAQQILDGFFDREDVMYLLSEIGKFLNSIGNPTKIKAWVEGIVQQRRKLKIDIMWDNQRLMSVDNRLREHTARYYVPRKFHCDDGTHCTDENCMRPHFIKVFCEKPFLIPPIAEFDCEEIGNLYNTNEIIRDEVNAPDRDQPKTRSGRKKAPVNISQPVRGRNVA